MWHLYDLSLNPSPLDEGLGILQILAESSPLSRGEGRGVRFSDVTFELPHPKSLCPVGTTM